MFWALWVLLAGSSWLAARTKLKSSQRAALISARLFHLSGENPNLLKPCKSDLSIMKTLIAFGLLSTVSALAQGTFNASNNYTVPGASTKALIFVVEGIPLAKSVGRVAVQNATDGSFLSPNGAAGVALTLDGLFFINGLTVPDVAPGGTAHVIVRAWDASTGPNWFDALVRSNPGSGLVTVNNLGGGLTPAASFAADSNFTGLTFFVPEPSTVALTALGVAGIFFVARRKN
ncbi:MAG: PEP-CTERM sorting domain-containing protein [Verrucomicrobia bacterium]|nr:PEP-CTERM sorting domain-containing protein [Verrucomicrobiota bacterium]